MHYIFGFQTQIEFPMDNASKACFQYGYINVGDAKLILSAEFQTEPLADASIYFFKSLIS